MNRASAAAAKAAAAAAEACAAFALPFVALRRIAAAAAIYQPDVACMHLRAAAAAAVAAAAAGIAELLGLPSLA